MSSLNTQNLQGCLPSWKTLHLHSSVSFTCSIFERRFVIQRMQCIQTTRKRKKKKKKKQKKNIQFAENFYYSKFLKRLFWVWYIYSIFFFLRSFVHFIFSSSSVSRSDWSCAKFTAAKRSAKQRKLHFESLPLIQLTFAKLYSHTSTKFHSGKKSALYSNEMKRRRKKKRTTYVCDLDCTIQCALKQRHFHVQPRK